jgi:hypothetical protein
VPNLATPIEPDVRAALNPIQGGQYRVEDVDGRAVVPSWWLHSDSLTGLGALQDISFATLDLWHESVGDLDEALAKLEFLREHDILGVGSYRRQSVTVLHEAQNVHHATILLAATHFAGA